MTRRVDALRGELDPAVSVRARFSGGELRECVLEGRVEKVLADGMGR